MYKKYFVIIYFFFSSLLFSLNLKIASYNVENLFNMHYNGNEYDAYVPNKHNWTRSTYKKKLLNISEVICDMNADIIALQELENENVLKALQKSLRSIGCFYKYRAISHKSKSAIQVALLSKVPFMSSKELVVHNNYSYRNILEVKFRIESNLFYIFVNHWNSKASMESKRIRSANTLMKRLSSFSKGTEYIVLGDFNTDYNEYKHIEKKLDDTAGKIAINHTLQTIVSNKMVQKKDINKASNLHYNLWLEKANFQRWSHNFYGKKQALDSIILPSSMFNHKGLEYVDGSFKCFNPSYLFHKKGYIYRWQYKNKKHLAKGYSDHLPIVATFSTSYRKKRDSLTVRESKIENIYATELKEPLLLKEVKVIFRSKYHAIVKQREKGRAIFIYGAEGLEESSVYDIVVHGTKNYHGLHEITNFTIEKKYRRVMVKNYYYQQKIDFKNRKLENELLQNLSGVYRNNKFYIEGKPYKIYFRNKRLRPKDGTKLKLHRVQIGYYDAMQLVVWSAEDFMILE